MSILELKDRLEISDNTRIANAHLQFGELLRELRKKQLPDTVIESLNKEVQELNILSDTDKNFLKILKSKQASIIKFLEKEVKIVPKNYYRNLWLAVGIGAFGLPIGVAFALAIGNMALLSIGLPIGIGLGMALGARMDKRAFEENRQLDVEIKY